MVEHDNEPYPYCPWIQGRQIHGDVAEIMGFVCFMGQHLFQRRTEGIADCPVLHKEFCHFVAVRQKVSIGQFRRYQPVKKPFFVICFAADSQKSIGVAFGNGFCRFAQKRQSQSQSGQFRSQQFFVEQAVGFILPPVSVPQEKSL